MNRTSQRDSRNTTGAQSPSADEPSHEEIAALALHIYEEEGCIPGHDEEHWHEAERRLRRRAEGAAIGAAELATPR